MITSQELPHATVSKVNAFRCRRNMVIDSIKRASNVGSTSIEVSDSHVDTIEILKELEGEGYKIIKIYNYAGSYLNRLKVCWEKAEL